MRRFREELAAAAPGGSGSEGAAAAASKLQYRGVQQVGEGKGKRDEGREGRTEQAAAPVQRAARAVHAVCVFSMGANTPTAPGPTGLPFLRDATLAGSAGAAAVSRAEAGPRN